MLSIGTLSSASGAASYFIKGGEGQISGYYSAHQEASKWGGAAKEFFNLKDGPVDLKTFEALLDGQVSDKQTLGRMVKDERLRDPGRDFTFSAPKSVSAAAIGELEKPIIEAFARSVEKAMSYYQEHFAQTRVYDKNTGKQVGTGDQKILYASFIDFLSRANDPQLHIHVPVVNLAIGQDDKIRSQNFSLAYKHKILLGNIQRAELAKELRGLGLNIRPAGKNGLWELEGSSTEILMNFSKRRQQMTRLAPHKTKDAAAMARIAKLTRPAKDTVDPKALRARWKEELKTLGTSIEEYTKAVLSAPERDQTQLTPKAAITYAISHMSETQAHFDKYTLLKEAMVSVYGHVDIKAMTGELNERVEAGQLLISEDGRWLKPASTHKLEQKITHELAKGHLQGKALGRDAFEAHSGAFEGLTPGQKKAAELVLTDKHRFVGIEGTAGTGKTFLNKTTLPLLKEMGYELIGMAPTLKAVEQLEKTELFDKTMTVQAFHKSPVGTSKTVLVVDEAGMIGNDIMHSILNYANMRNMPRVVLQGDPEQLPPIEAGRPFEQLLQNGLRSVRMEDVVRQTSKRHRKGVVQLSRHEVKEAFLTFQKEIHQVPLKDQEKYVLKLRAQMNDPSIIVNTNAQREAINTTISKSNSNELSPESHKQRIWSPVYLSKAEKTRVASYEGATHIRFNRDVGRDFKRGEIYRIDKIDHDKARLILRSKQATKPYSPARHGSGETFTHIYKQSEITLNQGDKIKFRQTNKKLGITNNDYGVIQSLSNGQVTISREEKKPISLPKGHRLLGHLDHAWANTTHSFQGVTVENNIAVMNAAHSPLNTLEALYVAGSRHTDKLAIVTDDKDRLLRMISEKLDIASETITFKEPLQMRLVDPRTIPESREQHDKQEISNERYNTSDDKPKSQPISKRKENTPTEPIQRERGDRGR